MGCGTGSIPRAMEFQHHPGVCKGGLGRSTGKLEDAKDGRRILPSQKAGQRGLVAIPDGHTGQDTDGSQEDEIRLQSGEGKGRGHRGAVGEVGRNRRQPTGESTEHTQQGSTRQHSYLSSLSTFFLEDEMRMALPLQPLRVREGQRGGDMCQMQGRAIAER